MHMVDKKLKIKIPQAQMVADALKEEKIPFKVFGAKRFWEIKVIRDMLCFLRLVKKQGMRCYVLILFLGAM